MKNLLARGLGVTLILITLGYGCDGDGGSDGGMDGDVGGSCDGAADGTSCGAGRVCIGGSCEASVCGDGVVDSAGGEQCDDGNDVAFDGCEPGSCVFTCSDNAECDDGLFCNGPERCIENTCRMGAPATDGSGCMTMEIMDGICRMGTCVPAGCGNGVVDAGENCDDMNDVDGDGCDNDCSFTCTNDLDCTDGDVCTGTETCDIPTHTCVPGTPLDCTDTDACTMDTCDPMEGCQFPLIDADMDGHAAESLGACGTDCDDSRDDVNPDEQEQCDSVDHDCDGSDIPPATPFWYLDCDGDGFATSGAPSMQVCSEPAPQPCGGGWTLTAPLNASTTDCNDADARARPDQTSFFSTAANGGGYDYNCMNGEEMRWTVTDADTLFCLQLFGGRGCFGSDGWTGTTVAPCGVARSFSDCYDADPGRGTSCTRRTITRTQECR